MEDKMPEPATPPKAAPPDIRLTKLVKPAGAPQKPKPAPTFLVEEEVVVEEEKPEGAPMWYLSFADMMTNMLVFFVLLVAIGTVEQEKFKKIAESLKTAFGTQKLSAGKVLDTGKQIPLAESLGVNAVDTMVSKEVNTIADDMQKFVAINNLAGKIEVHSDERGAVITVSDVVLFPMGEAKITTDGLKILKQIFDQLKQFNYHVKIEGHTDNTPIKTERFPSNWELSASRASEVARLLVEAGLPPDHLSVEGFAEFRPKTPNDSVEHRAANRRIEIVYQRDSIRRRMFDVIGAGGVTPGGG